MEILIVKLSAIGDVIHTLPALNALRRHYPEARITWLVEEAASCLVVGHEALDRVLISKRKKWIQGLQQGHVENLRKISRFVRNLRDTSYDLVLDFQGLLKSSVWVALARGRRKIGFGPGMEHMERSYLFLTERVPAVDMEIHALTRGLILLQSLGIETDEIAYDLPIRDKDRLLAKKLLASGDEDSAGPYVAVHPMAKWGTKLWNCEKFAFLADRLVERYKARVIFTGESSDGPVIDEILTQMQYKGLNLAGMTDLMGLAALYEACRVVVSTDTGPMHLAAAVGKPVVGLFGPTAPWRTGPFGDHHAVVRADLPCSPCFKRTCESTACMKAISVDQVLESVEGIW